MTAAALKTRQLDPCSANPLFCSFAIP